jgi:hypothetical protein
MQNVRMQGRLEVVGDAIANDSDKTYTVPAGEEWYVVSVFAVLAATATVGNRRVTVQVLDASDNVLASVPAGAVQAASATVSYNFAPGIADQTSAVNSVLGTSLPAFVLGAGMKLKVFDAAAIDAAADDLTVRATVKKVKA